MFSKTFKKLFLIIALSLPMSMNSAAESAPVGPVGTFILGPLIWNTLLSPFFVAGKIVQNPQSARKYLTSPFHIDTIGGKRVPYLNPILSGLGLAAYIAYCSFIKSS